MVDPNMRTFRHVKFRPSEPGDREGEYINMFRGFKGNLVDKVDIEKIQPILDHLRNALCRGHQDVAEWILDWQAHTLQKPGEKKLTAVVHTGPQGAGKNLYWEYFGIMLIGIDHFISTNNINQLTGRFNSHQALALFVFANEVTIAGAHQQNQQLKSLISEMWSLLELKDIDAVMVENFCTFVFLSNLMDAMRIEDTDRRYTITETSSIQDDALYSVRLRKIMKDEDVANHFFTFLMQRDISNFEHWKPPMTQIKKDMATFTQSPYELFVASLLNGEIHIEPPKRIYQSGEMDQNGNWTHGQYVEINPVYFEPDETYETTMAKMFDLYIKFANTKTAKTREIVLNNKSFGNKLRKDVPIKNKSKNRNGGTKVDITIRRRTKEDGLNEDEEESEDGTCLGEALQED